ncbi:hypothetical protein HHI36_016542 [Cryptolaemus montrouzieri]|uniref:Uncharacterized protein n=1 Tax=Cryptolaemus montrouzieri TaxID=559131 RepID=A0ABD2NKU2_9CUCU
MIVHKEKEKLIQPLFPITGTTTFYLVEDIDEIQKLLWDDEDDQGQEEFGDESDTDAEDNVETREENSETEQSDTSDEEDEIESTNFQENQTYYMGRDKETKWFSSAFPEGRRQAHNITKRLPGVIGEAKTCVR